MAYQVTARRWRPQTFAEIIGQEHISRTLRNALEMGRIAHAYLFSGSRGVGKTTTARILAKAVNCAGGPRPEPCNACPSCQEVSAGSSLDVIEIDGASNRGIEQIRELRETIHYVPVRGAFKVYIIDEVHMLTKEAFNALLKTLEEPPPHVIFIFATTEQSRVPLTILSRCQCYEFKRLPQALIAGQLERIAGEEKVRISPSMVQLLARMAQGSMRDAQSLFDQVVSFCGTEIDDENAQSLLGAVRLDSLRACLEALSSRDARVLLETLHQVVERGTAPLALCQEILEQFRHLLVIQRVAEPGSLIDVPPPHLEELRRLATRFSDEEVQLFYRILFQTETEMRRSTDPLLHLEVGLLRLIQVKPLASLDELVERLDRLEERLTGKSSAPEPSPSSPTARDATRPYEAQPSAVPARKPQPAPPPPKPPAPSRGGEKGPVAAGALSPDDLWNEIVSRAAERKPLLGTYLEPGKLVENGEQALTVAYARGDALHREKIKERENLQVVEEAAAAVLGRKVRVRLQELPSRTPAENPAPASPPQAEKKESGKNHSGVDIVQEALELFNGTIVM